MYLSARHWAQRLILKTPPKKWCCDYPHLPEKETEAQRVTCPSLHSRKVLELPYRPRQPDPRGHETPPHPEKAERAPSSWSKPKIRLKGIFQSQSVGRSSRLSPLKRSEKEGRKQMKHYPLKRVEKSMGFGVGMDRTSFC